MSGKEPHDFLIEDLKHFSESLWRNDEIGEKRFNFLLGLVTAVLAGLVTLNKDSLNEFQDVLTSKAGAGLGMKFIVSYSAVCGLLILGMLTYVRLLLRNRVTDEYHLTLAYIRRRLIALYPEVPIRDYRVPVRLEKSRYDWVWKRLKVGLAGLTGALNGCLLFVVVALAPVELSYRWTVATAAGIGLFILCWALAARRGRVTPLAQHFRGGVGAVIVNKEGHVLALERAKIRGAWQLPQGGIEPGEEPGTAVWREIEEETGIQKGKLQCVGRYPHLLVYELPPPARSEKTGRGQVQYWFYFAWRGDDVTITLPPDGEFRRYEWMPIHQLVDQAVEFRKPIYCKLAECDQLDLSRKMAA